MTIAITTLLLAGAVSSAMSQPAPKGTWEREVQRFDDAY